MAGTKLIRSGRVDKLIEEFKRDIERYEKMVPEVENDIKGLTAVSNQVMCLRHVIQKLEELKK